MFVALARAVSRHRPAVLAGALAILVLAVLSVVRGGSLTSGTIEGTESARAAALVRGAAGADTDTSVVALFSHRALPATDPLFQGALALQLDKVSARPEVESVVSMLNAPQQARSRFVSRDGRSALVLVRLKGDEKAAVKAFPAVSTTLRDGPFTAAITGKPAFLFDLNTELEHDLLRAELISFPLALVVLLWVFRTLVAAVLPIVVGGLAVLAGVGAVLALSHHVDMAQYTLNVVSLIGLGVAIDYSLFIVSRFRAELEGGSERRRSARAHHGHRRTRGGLLGDRGRRRAVGTALLPGLVPRGDGARRRHRRRLLGPVRPHPPAGHPGLARAAGWTPSRCPFLPSASGPGCGHDSPAG